ncbi:phosphatidylinositol glycan anchor biosynthesis class U protein [Condylostylus longicornis]|uniref:phosphatidylinositol glycan anchor biosynthesis class U protein n=1 Tax=Condylostylus longicornis TaxID=2530218 RepID=UPI00244DE01F|nr:phosphatidylinositol glycan anchor biosynthesis class U protein [Condylostylus longicornis]XP_055382012.1 phosphatidylinositol glycan anchor biosynthesis class U protein [Condylostylus longicornis]XP_055382013.1 phosphatidylinositol glycan anchor biosynthesis class U protein [Condylostylus longicornis]XP_055382014.1 phosphatidylinositol glycan anchor biosynthesis class U protein [Condylostylus longicornis]
MKIFSYFAIAAGIRYALYKHSFDLLKNRVEISTPVNAHKRLLEGVFLYNRGYDPYYGDIVHEPPFVLIILAWIINNFPKILPLAYIIADLVTGLILSMTSKFFCDAKIEKQVQEKHKYAPGTEKTIQFDEKDKDIIPHYILISYFFNPFAIINCAALTSTVFSNLFLALFMYFLSKKNSFCLIFLAFETTRNFYAFALITTVFATLQKPTLFKYIAVFFSFVTILTSFIFINFFLNKSNWSFINSTIAFTFFYQDLQPNIGLFWYFFTEMFEHFRTMFLITFQMNATVLYLIPLSFRLREDSVKLATVLIALMAIFKSYPCLGDVSLYLSLLPIWKQCWKFMAHNFVVFCFFLINILIMPALWHLWIYCGSANANFYFGATLAFSTGQIFLVTDLLFAYAKLEFCLKHGEKIFAGGKEAKIVLE